MKPRAFHKIFVKKHTRLYLFRDTRESKCRFANARNAIKRSVFGRFFRAMEKPAWTLLAEREIAFRAADIAAER